MWWFRRINSPPSSLCNDLCIYLIKNVSWISWKVKNLHLKPFVFTSLTECIYRWFIFILGLFGLSCTASITHNILVDTKTPYTMQIWLITLLLLWALRWLQLLQCCWLLFLLLWSPSRNIEAKFMVLWRKKGKFCMINVSTCRCWLNESTAGADATVEALKLYHMKLTLAHSTE